MLLHDEKEICEAIARVCHRRYMRAFLNGKHSAGAVVLQSYIASRREQFKDKKNIVEFLNGLEAKYRSDSTLDMAMSFNTLPWKAVVQAGKAAVVGSDNKVVCRLNVQNKNVIGNKAVMENVHELLSALTIISTCPAWTPHRSERETVLYLIKTASDAIQKLGVASESICSH